MDGEVLASIAVFLVVTVLLSWYSHRKKARQWRGRVETVKSYSRHDERYRDHPTVVMITMYTIVYRKDDGSKVKETVDENQFKALYPGGLTAGDRVEKKAGGWWPEKVTDSR